MQNTSSTIVTSVYKSRHTILKQLSDLGYNTDDYGDFSLSEIDAKYENKQLDMLLEKKVENPETGKKGKIYVLYYLAKSLIRPANIQDIIDDLFITEEVLTKDDVLFIVAKEEVNDTHMGYLKHLWETEGLFIIIQSIKRLQFNIQDHTMVPKHEIMNMEQIKQVKQRYNITSDNEFPEISRFDPVAISICMRPGEVCKIIRASKNAITSKYYRVCV